MDSQDQVLCQSVDLLSGEESIVWTEDIDALPYVRSMTYPVATRHLPPVPPRFAGADRVVGYSVLRSDAPPMFPGVYRRRIFWLASGDRANDPEGAYRVSCPEDAIDPMTVKPGEPGRLTERSFPTLQPLHFPTTTPAPTSAVESD